jgi:pimeloyl-ACP methyl ester carboxylesterase
MKPNTLDTISLDNDRKLEFAEYGDPQGDPLLFFHGLIGSHHQASLAHEAARIHQWRIVAPNRQGIGRSTSHETRTIVERMNDTRQLLQKLNIGEFGTIGVSGGAPYALAAAHVFRERVRSVNLISGMGPVADMDLLLRMEPSRRRVLFISRLPWLAQLYLSWRARKRTKNPEALLRSIMRRLPEADRKMFAYPPFRRMFFSDLESVFVQGTGVKGLSRELRRYFHWGFELSDLPAAVRVRLWHGTEDRVVRSPVSQYMAQRLPNAELSLHPGGHFMIVSIIGDVMRQSRQSMKR